MKNVLLPVEMDLRKKELRSGMLVATASTDPSSAHDPTTIESYALLYSTAPTTT